jgi:sodium transport system permease protein
LALELILLSRQLGIATISGEELADKQPLVDRLVAQWREISPLVPLIAVAIVPAVCEELFFRGYLLGAMRGRLPGWLAILFTGLIFGLFHASVGGLIAVERVLSSTLLGLVFGWLAWTTRSIIPGMLAHALVNAFVVALAYGGDTLKAWGLDSANLQHLPPAWLAGSSAIAAVGIALAWLGRNRKNRDDPSLVGSEQPEAS